MNTPLSDAELSRLVHQDLHELLRRGPPVVAVQRLSPLSSPVLTRTTFRIDLAGGGSVKAHQLESAKTAEEAVMLCDYLPRGAFSRILGHHGRALLSEWIDGLALSARTVTQEDCRWAGERLRSIHEIALPPTIVAATEHYPGPTSWQALWEKIEWLSSAGHLTSAEAARTTTFVRDHAPPEIRKTLVHGDLCPENIVIDDAGSRRVVDNDGIDVHAPAFDLARTWYRWPMSTDERDAFERGYGESAAMSSFHAHFLHWGPMVLVAAAEFRLRARLAGGDLPLSQLRTILSRDPGPI